MRVPVAKSPGRDVRGEPLPRSASQKSSAPKRSLRSAMMRAHRVRQTYDHRLRDAIAATRNADLFRDVSIPASTRRTWARGEVRPMVAAVDAELEVYDLLEQVDQLRQRARVQAAIIGLLVRLLNLRGGNRDGIAFPMVPANPPFCARSRRRPACCR